MTEQGFEACNEQLRIDEVELNISAIKRGGSKQPILFLHGFGSSKEDYADITLYPDFDDRPFLVYDAPGCGDTSCSDLSKISIPFLVDTALGMLEKSGLKKFHLVGHSMGGLTALYIATRYPEKVLSFIDIEGNIAPEDCFLSRQIIHHENPDPEIFFQSFADRVHEMSAFSSALYSKNLRQKVRPGAVKSIFTSMVYLSDNDNLMDKYLALSCPKMFMYGSQNSTLSYLDHIKRNGVQLSQVPHCGHFPMYSNPPFMWREIAEFIDPLE